MNDILSAFQRKILSNALTEQDFLKPGLFGMFYGKSDTPFVKTIADCKNPTFEQGEEKYIFHIPLDDGWEVRMDFVLENGVYKLSSMDCYTLPLKKIDRLPFNCFEPLTEKQEARMREEYRITKMVNDFVRLKNIIGKEKALEWFKDGEGEQAGVCVWMPYFTKRKAFTAYSAWIQNRLYGEDVYITAFSEEYSELIFKNSNWLFLYKTAVHLKRMISDDEYLELYETIWKDRAVCNGYMAEISYEEDDICIRLSAIV